MNQTTKERKEAHGAQERARQTNYEKMATGPKPKTWNARMPAYCFTELCSDQRYRPEIEGRETIGQRNSRPVLRDERGNQRYQETEGTLGAGD